MLCFLGLRSVLVGRLIVVGLVIFTVTFAGAGEGPAAKSRPLTEALKAPANLQFDRVPLEDVVKTLRQEQGITINLDRSGLAAGINGKQLVTCDLVGLRLQVALDRMLQGLELDWIVVDDSVLVTTPARATSVFEIRFYNVSDLDAAPVGPPGGYLAPQTGAGYAPQVTRATFTEQVPVAGGFDPNFADQKNPAIRSAPPIASQVTRKPVAESTNISLIELIESSVVANWKSQEPHGTPIRRMENRPNLLVIRQPQRVHRDIEVLLARLRAEINKGAGQSADGLTTVAYPVGQKDDLVTQLIRAAVTEGAATNQAGQVQLQGLKLPACASDQGLPSEKLGVALTEMIEPESWIDRGGRGILRAMPGVILIQQTPEIHAQIRQVLSSISPMEAVRYQPCGGAAFKAPTDSLPAY